MKLGSLFVTALCSILLHVSSDIAHASGTADQATLDRGRYLVKLGGCNDCHTSGYLLSAGNIPEDQWLKGDFFGWRGPWGTTYAPNLRLRMVDFTEGEWLTFAKGLKTRPPMPWFTLNEIEDDDLAAIYHFIRYLGPEGPPAPEFVPPEQEPPPPYALFPSPPSSE